MAVTTTAASDEPERVAPDAPARRPESAPAPESVELEVTEALPRILKIVGSVVAPTTLLTGLLFYFGRLHVTGMFRYLRVNFTVLDLSVQDYLIRSADGLFVPLTATAGMTLLLLWTHGLVVGSVPKARRQAAARRAAPGAALAGVILLSVAMVGLSRPATFASVPEVPGLFLAVGVLLLAYAVRLRRSIPPSGVAAVSEWAAVFVVVAIGLFWAVGNYAIAVGTSRGHQIEQQLAGAPDVVVYSVHELYLAAPTITRSVCGQSAESFRYRYDGLKLVMQSSGQYLFLPQGWTHDSGPAIVIPRTDTIRLEFAAPGTTDAGTC